MQPRLPIVILLVLASLLATAGAVSGQGIASPMVSREVAVVDSSIDVLNEIMSIPAPSIPTGLLDKAEGIAIIPGMIKGGFIVGVRYGRGVVVTRDAAGKWKPPMFIDITGASVGWQAGIQGTDLVLVFRSKNSLLNLLQGKFTIGVNASAAAGPVGRDAQAATDAALKAEILSYSRSRGLFAGIALDGAVLNVDAATTNAYYSPAGGIGQLGALPPSAVRLQEQLAKYAPAGRQTPQPWRRSWSRRRSLGRAAGWALDNSRRFRRSASNTRAARGFVATAFRRVRSYVAGVSCIAQRSLCGRSPAVGGCMRVSLDHFGTVASQPRYQTLAARPEFRTTWSLLQQYAAAPQPAAQPLALPPPPR